MLEIFKIYQNLCFFPYSNLNTAKQPYENALLLSGYNYKMQYVKPNVQTPKRKRRRKILWFNPPFSENVKTNVGRIFLNLVKKHFNKDHRYKKIFNKNNIKVSYSCVENMGQIIKKHNKKILQNKKDDTEQKCNCKNRLECPLENNCLAQNIIYQATVTANDKEAHYIGLTERTFKDSFYKHSLSFHNHSYSNNTELSKYFWNQREKDVDFSISWKILSHASPYDNISNRCNLCLLEKYFIINYKGKGLLNKRNEMISKCRHENKFYIKNYKTAIK